MRLLTLTLVICASALLTDAVRPGRIFDFHVEDENCPGAIEEYIERESNIATNCVKLFVVDSGVPTPNATDVCTARPWMLDCGSNVIVFSLPSSGTG